MSDATVTGDATTTKAKRGNVEYTLEVVDALPEGGQVNSPFEEFLDKIVAIYENEATRGQLFDATGNAKWVVIGKYEKATAAGAAANVLGQRHGKQPNVEGWDFASRRIDDTRTGLFVRYDPTRIVPGAKEQWDRHEAKRKQKLAANREAKKSGQTAAASSAAPTGNATAGVGTGGNVGGNGAGVTTGDESPTDTPSPVPSPVPVPQPGA